MLQPKTSNIVEITKSLFTFRCLMVCYTQMPQHLWSQKDSNWDQRLFFIFSYSEALTLLRSHRVYLRPDDFMVCCSQIPQHYRSHKESIWDQMPLWSIVAKEIKISEVTKSLFVIRGLYGLLWPEALTLSKSQSVYMRPENYMACCSQMPKHCWSHKESIYGQSPHYF